MHTDNSVRLSCGVVVLAVRLQVLRSLTKNEDLIGVLTYMWADYVSTKYCNNIASAISPPISTSVLLLLLPSLDYAHLFPC